MKRIFYTYKELFLLTLIGIPIGIAVGTIDAIFGWVLLRFTEIRTQYTYWLIPFLGVVGAGIAWHSMGIFAYTICKREDFRNN